jgi:exonuclease III
MEIANWSNLPSTKMDYKIVTLNLCLGLPNKKNLVKEIIINEKIDILCLQETKLQINLDHNLLSFPGASFESENNDICSRVGVYINSNIIFTRRIDLEGHNSHLIILDIEGYKKLRIINIYRPFNPQNAMAPKEFFVYQMELIRIASTNNTIVQGDFNLNLNKKGLHNYSFGSYFVCLDNVIEQTNMVQLVDFTTWSRKVNGVVRESVLDHVYASDPTLLTNLSSLRPVFGDHCLVHFKYTAGRPLVKTTIKRNWMHYDKEQLIVNL